MSRQINWDAIPDRTNLDPRHYRMKILSIKELPTDERNPHLTYLGTFQVEEPEEYEGEIHSERFRIGDDNDPQGQEESTWRRSLGAKNIKKLLKASNSPFLDTEEATYEAARGNVFIGKIVKTPGRAGTANEGQEFSNMRGYFSVTSPEALQVGQVSSPGLQTTNGLGTTPTQNMTCPTCQNQVPRADFGKHLNVHKQEEAAAAAAAAQGKPAAPAQ